MATDRQVDSQQERRLEAMFRAHAGSVHGFAAHALDAESAEDVVSETFMAAWRRIDDVPDPALPWLLGTARRVVANQRRSKDRQTRLAARVASATASTWDDPADVAIGDRVDVLALLRKLPVRDREALVLRGWYDLTGHQAAQVLGSTRAAYAIRLSRARTRLRSLLIAGGTGSGAEENAISTDQEAPR